MLTTARVCTIINYENNHVPAKANAARADDGDMKNYVLKVKLNNTQITRTLAIPADYGFYDLHEAIQVAFGWEGFFYHEFEIGGVVIADDANEEYDLLPEKFKYEYEANLEFFLMNVKNFTYTYDIEQPWVHSIDVEGVLEEGFDYPVLLECAGQMIVETAVGDDDNAVSLGPVADKNYINFMLKSIFNE